MGAERWKPGPTALVSHDETLRLADGLEKEGWRLTRSAGAIGRRLVRWIERQPSRKLGHASTWRKQEQRSTKIHMCNSACLQQEKSAILGSCSLWPLE